MQRYIGFKGALKNIKDLSLKLKIKELYWQLRYAWQRAWIGYDSTDIFELGFNFVERMPILLREFKENNIALFPDLDNPDRLSLTAEETNAVIDEMIFYFENCDEDVVYQRLYGIDPYEDGCVYEKWLAAHNEADRCWNEAMRLFSKWSMCLWY